MKPDLIEIKGGWAAMAKTWAVFGKTQEEALAKFAEREQRRREIEALPNPVLGENGNTEEPGD